MDSDIRCELTRENVALGSKISYGDQYDEETVRSIRGMYNVYEVISPDRNFQLICLADCDVDKIVKMVFSVGDSSADDLVSSEEFAIGRCFLKSTTLTRLRIGSVFNWCSRIELFDPGQSGVFALVFGFEPDKISWRFLEVFAPRAKYSENLPMKYEWIRDIDVGMRIRFASPDKTVYQKALPGKYSLFNVSGDWSSHLDFQLICDSRCDPKLLLNKIRLRRREDGWFPEMGGCKRLHWRTGSNRFLKRLTFTTERDSAVLKSGMEFCHLLSFSDPRSEACFAWAVGNLLDVVDTFRVSGKVSEFFRNPLSLLDSAKFRLRKLIAKKHLASSGLPESLIEFVANGAELNVSERFV